MKNLFILFTVLFSVLISNAQFVGFDWVKQIGNVSYDGAYSIAVDEGGNVYTTGYFSGITDFDPGIGVFNLTSTGSTDIFISKLDALGNFLWAKRMGGTVRANSIFIALDNIGNIYTTGGFDGKVDFDPGPNTFYLTSNTEFGYGNTFISKLDPSGNFIWAKQFIGDAFSIGHSLSIDDLGNVYTIGSFYTLVDFDPGNEVFDLTAKGYEDVYISKLDSSGNFIWAKQIGGTDYVEGTCIQVDATGSNIYITGAFWGTVDFNPNEGVLNISSNGSRDIFISKLNSLGNLVWAKSIGGIDADRGHSIALDNSNNIYITGEYSGTTDFNPGIGVFNLTAVLGQDCFVTKLDESGNFIWAKSIGGTGPEEPGNCIKLDSKGDIIVTGWFSGTSDFDPGVNTYNLTSLGSVDVFITKLNATGNFVWAVQLGGVTDPFNGVYVSSWSSAIDGQDNICTAGSFAGTVDFDPRLGTFNLTPVGLDDIFIHKMHSESLGVSENYFKEKYKLYPNPTKGHLQIDIDDIQSEISVIVFNQLTQVVQTEKFNFSNHIDINLTGNSGVYFIEIQSGNGALAYFKVIKN